VFSTECSACDPTSDAPLSCPVHSPFPGLSQNTRTAAVIPASTRTTLRSKAPSINNHLCCCLCKARATQRCLLNSAIETTCEHNHKITQTPHRCEQRGPFSEPHRPRFHESGAGVANNAQLLSNAIAREEHAIPTRSARAPPVTTVLPLKAGNLPRTNSLFRVSTPLPRWLPTLEDTPPPVSPRRKTRATASEVPSIGRSTSYTLRNRNA